MEYVRNPLFKYNTQGFRLVSDLGCVLQQQGVLFSKLVGYHNNSTIDIHAIAVNSIEKRQTTLKNHESKDYH